MDYQKVQKLWLNYQNMLEVAREIIKADRTGSWQMHLHAVSESLPHIRCCWTLPLPKNLLIFTSKI